MQLTDVQKRMVRDELDRFELRLSELVDAALALEQIWPDTAQAEEMVSDMYPLDLPDYPEVCLNLLAWRNKVKAALRRL